MISVAPPRARRRTRAVRIAVLLAVIAVAVLLWTRGAGLIGRQYEYEESLVVRLDGSARLTVNASIAALVALRGLDLDPQRPVDRERVRAVYDCPAARVRSVPRPWERRGRRFVQINLDIDDVRRAHECPPLSWSRYELLERDGQSVFRQTVGESAFQPGTLQNVGWVGGEIVAFRLHLPARILEHNARTLEEDEPAAISRGNILAWEQHLADRLDGQPLAIAVRMENRTILFLTLWLFAGAFLAAVLTLGGVVWWMTRRATPEEAGGRRPGPAP